MKLPGRHLTDLRQEIHDHIEYETRENVARGMTPEQASEAARKAFGNVTRIEEDTRAVWIPVWLDELLQDVRYAFRVLRHSPGFAATVVLTLALGIGANIAVYNIIYRVLIQPLPFREPDRLVQLWENTPALPELQATVPDFEDWRAQTHSFDEMAAYTLQAMNKITMIGQGDPEMIQATMATSNLFPMMGVEPLLGRNFGADEERTKQNVGLISEKLWRSKFAADPGIVGKTIQLETGTFVVLGVISSRQAFPAWADFWMPFSFVDSNLRQRRKFHPLEVIARLKSGVAESQAQTDLRSIAERLRKDHAETNANVGAYLIPLARETTGDARPSLLIIWAAVGLVLLMACANLAQLVSARMVRRSQEMAARAALGAGAGRLMRQVLTESLVLAAMGGLVGGLLASGITKILRNLAGGAIPRMEWDGFQNPVWLFAVLLSVLCGVLFGLPAAWNATRSQSLGPSRTSGRSVTRERSRLSSVLMVVEVALAFVVLAGAVILFRSFALLLDENPGYQPHGVFTLQVPLPSTRYPINKTGPFFDDRLLPAVKNLPGVTDVAAANSPPMSLGRTEHSRFATRFGIEGRTFEPGQFPVAQLRWVTPEYFHLLGISLKRGRYLNQDDRNQPRYLINETLARRYFPGQDPTVKRILMNVVDPHPVTIEIAGVVGDVREMGLDEEVAPTLYTIGTSPVMTLLVRTGVDPRQMAATVRRVVYGLDPMIAVSDGETLDQYVSDSLARRRFALLMIAAFAGIAVFLAAAGIYGALAYSVGGRLREFAIRAAVGATPANLLRMVFGEAAAIAIPGLAAGVLLSVAFAGFLRSEVYQLAPNDPASMIGTGVLLIAIIFLSAWLPAHRAARVNTGSALRAE